VENDSLDLRKGVGKITSSLTFGLEKCDMDDNSSEFCPNASFDIRRAEPMNLTISANEGNVNK
jgi:hypothetical protein